MTMFRLRRFLWSSGLLILALTPGIGLAGAALSPLWRALVAGPPVTQPDRLVIISEISRERGWTDAPASPANLRDWERRAATLASVAFHTSGRSRGEDAGEVVLSDAAGGRLIRVLGTSSNLMDTLGVKPARGRGFAPEDCLPSSQPVALVSDALAQRLSRGGGDAIGRTIRLDDREVTVIGQMPPGFYYPTSDVEVWTPIRIDTAEFTSRRQARIFRVVARLSDRATLATADQELRQIAAALSTEYPRTNGNTSVQLEPLREWLTGPRRVTNALAATAGALILLIAVINAGLVAWMTDAARYADREIRRALGASPSRLMTDASANTAATMAVAVVLAVPVAFGAVAAANASMGVGSGEPFTLDWRALVLAALASLIGLAAVRLRWIVAPAPIRVVPARVRWIGAVQAALSIILVAAAVATFRGFMTLAAAPSGLPPDSSAATATVTLRGPRFRDETIVTRYVRGALDQIRSLPGVSAAGATALLPLSGAGWTSFIWLPERGVVNAEVRHREITDGYVKASGLPLLEGREFTADDGPAAPVALVNEAFVRQVTAGRSPLGLELSYSDPAAATPRRRWRIVGVVGNERVDPRRVEDVPIIYQPHAVTPEETMTFVVRTDRPAGDISKILRDLDPAAVVLRAEPIAAALARPVSRERAMAQLAGAISLVAVLLAALGLHGLTSLDASQRRREWAVRMALGASAARIRRHLFRRALTPAAVGLATGIVSAVLLAQVVASKSSTVSLVSSDLLWAGLIIVGAAVLACLPAVWRTGSQPSIDLR